MSLQSPRPIWTQSNRKLRNILKIDDPPNFQTQVASGQLEKPLATATLKFESGDKFLQNFTF